MATGKIGLNAKLVPVRVKSLRDIARIAANIVALGQVAYIVRFQDNQKNILGLIAVLRDYYDLYGLPILYYYVDEENQYTNNRYILVKVDEEGEHIQASNTAKHGWVPVPIIDFQEKPPFLPENLTTTPTTKE